MKKLILCLCTLCLLSSSAFAADAQKADLKKVDGKTWSNTLNSVKKLRTETKSEALLTRKAIQQQRAELRKERAEMRAERARRKAHHAKLLAQFEDLTAQELALRQQLESRKAEMDLLSGSVRGAARQLKERALISPATAENPEQLATLSALLDSGHFPGLSGIQSLSEMSFAAMKSSGEVVKRKGMWIGDDGSEHNGTILRLGILTAGFVSSDGAGFLRPAAGGMLEAVSGDLNGAVGALEEFVQGKRIDAPVDFSGGEAFKRFEKKSSFALALENGGFLVWPILLAGLIGLGIAAERFWTLWRIRMCPECKMEKAFVWAGRGNRDKCASCLGTKGSTPTCRVLSHVILHSGGTLVSMEKGLQEAILQELPLLERYLPTMNILAAVAPLLGLLGTVTGMINTFQVITVFGAGDPRLMSGGISEALITTQLGLAVAVPLTLMHHFLERKVDRIVADMEEKGTTLVARLVAAGGRE